MSGSYASNKKSIYNWRNKNRDKLNEYQNKCYYNKKVWKLISLEFRNILLEE